MDYMVVIILIALVLAGLAAVILPKACRHRPAADAGRSKADSSQPKARQGLSGAVTGDSASDSQAGTTTIGSAPIPSLPPGASPTDLPSSSDTPSAEMPGADGQEPESRPAKPATGGAAEVSDETESPDSLADPRESPAGASAQSLEPDRTTREPEVAAAQPDLVVPDAEQATLTDPESGPPKEEDTTRLTRVPAPIEATTQGESSPASSPVSAIECVDAPPAPGTAVLPEAAPESVLAVLAAKVDGGGCTPCSTPSSETEGAPKPEQVSEHTEESGSANGVMLGHAPEPVLKEEQPAHAAPSTGTATQQAGRDGLPVADEPAEDSEEIAAMEPQAAGYLQPSERPEEPRSPRIYRPTPRTPSQGRNSRQTNGVVAASRNRAMRIEVRVRFERGGFCRVSLLPQRDDALPAEIEVKGEGGPPALLALQDEWFQDVSLESISDVLDRGLVWQAEVKGLGTVWWNLSGRDIFVLGRRNDLSGYVTIPRLLLGEEHVVLCTEARLPSVLEALRAAGSPEPAVLHPDLGAPRGWVVLRGVTPKTPVSGSTEGDILDSLRPLADVEIVLLDGIRLLRTTWLAGYPPRIHLRGSAGEIEDVRIDGRPATRNTDGNYEAERWDASGTHEVWCPSASRSYTIQKGPEHWDAWDAYDWSLGEPTSVGPTVPAAICGMLVRPHDDRARERNAVTVPATNCVLIGSTPGEIYVCRPRAELRVSTHVAFPWFAPAWALPPDSMRCDKRVNRVIPMGCGEHAAPSITLGARGRTRSVVAWCRAILDAGLKGLAVEPADDGAKKLWRKYKLAARTIWRGRR